MELNKENYVYCGFNCNKCPILCATKSNSSQELIAILNTWNISFDPNKLEEYKCLGCKSNHLQNKFCSKCYIKTCCINKQIENCGFCDKYPCDYMKENIISNDSLEYLNTIHKKIFNNLNK